jgi:hypothetical protein
MLTIMMYKRPSESIDHLNKNTQIIQNISFQNHLYKISKHRRLKTQHPYLQSQHIINNGYVSVFFKRTSHTDNHIAGVAGIARIVLSTSLSVVRLILDIDAHEHDAEEAFTQQTIAALRQEYPDYNALMCHSAFRQNFTNSFHYHYEFPLTAPRSQGYEVFLFKAGEFWLDGDGGFVNWAYDGKFTKDPSNEHHIIFSDPSTLLIDRVVCLTD